MPDSTAHDLKALKRQLNKGLKEIQKLSQGTEEDRQPVKLDQSMVGRLSRMDALQNQAMHVEIERRRALESQRIEATLKRIAADDYGYCVSCGEEVEAKRLENDPTTPTCISCATQAG